MPSTEGKDEEEEGEVGGREEGGGGKGHYIWVTGDYKAAWSAREVGL